MSKYKGMRGRLLASDGKVSVHSLALRLRGQLGVILQVVALLLTSALSIAVQFGDVLPVVTRGFSCFSHISPVVEVCKPSGLRAGVVLAGALLPVGLYLLGELCGSAGVARRGLERSGRHVLGLAGLLLTCSVLQSVSGLQRPAFLRSCFPKGLPIPNNTVTHSCAVCSPAWACTLADCTNEDARLLSDASRSFPSTSAAVASYAALALASYVHCCCTWKMPLLAPFCSLALLLAACLVAMQRVLGNCNEPLHVAAGFALGLLLSAYVSVLNTGWHRKPVMRAMDRLILNELAEIGGLIRALHPSNGTKKLVDTAAGTSEYEYEYGPYMVIPKPEHSTDRPRSIYAQTPFSGNRDQPVRHNNGLFRVNFEDWPVSNANPNCSRLSLTNYDVEAMRLPRTYPSEEPNRSQRPAVNTRSAFAPSSSFIHAFYPSHQGEI